MRQTYPTAIILVLMMVLLAACGDVETEGNGQSAVTATTFQSESADDGTATPDPTETSVIGTATVQQADGDRATATLQPSETSVAGTATVERDPIDNLPTVTPDNSDLPLGGF